MNAARPKKDYASTRTTLFPESSIQPSARRLSKMFLSSRVAGFGPTHVPAQSPATKNIQSPSCVMPTR